MNIIVVENSDDVSYKEDVLSMSKNIKWVNNIPPYVGTDAYTHGIETGLKYVEDEYVFLSHNDVCITSEKFFQSLINKVRDGNQLIGTCSDTHPLRNKCIIILGCLVKTDIARNVDLYQKLKPDGSPYFETGDRIHIYCRENNVPHLCLDNTHNNPSLVEHLSEPYKSLDYVVRTVDDDNNVIFLHFARGMEKTKKTYSKKGRMDINQIVDFCEKNIFR